MCACVCGCHAGPESATAADELPLPLEYLAVHKELVLAYRLLEAHSLKVGVVELWLLVGVVAQSPS